MLSNKSNNDNDNNGSSSSSGGRHLEGEEDVMVDMDNSEGDDDQYDDEDEQIVQLQNLYYHAKGMVSKEVFVPRNQLQQQHHHHHHHQEEGSINNNDNSNLALHNFKEVILLESPKGEWSFKAMKQIVKHQYRHGQYWECNNEYKALLQFAAVNNTTISKNYQEKSIGNLLDFVSNCPDLDFLLLFYETTVAALASSKNERLLFKAHIKLGRLYFQRTQYARLSKVLKWLHKSCIRSDGTEDMKKAAQLLEVYSLELQFLDATKNTKKLKGLYQKCLSIKSGIPHPRIMGVIRECGGKMHMVEREWDKAYADFFEAFRNYDESGMALNRIRCLKYVILANMLTQSQINPFDSPEAKPYANTPEVAVMTQLQAAYLQNNIIDFERILKNNRKAILEDDDFIKSFFDDILKNIRSQVVLNLLKPYTRVRLPFIETSLNIPAAEVEDLLVSLILDNKIIGAIDQVNNCVHLSRTHERVAGVRKYNAISKWTTHLMSLQNTVVGSFKNGHEF